MSSNISPLEVIAKMHKLGIRALDAATLQREPELLLVATLPFEQRAKVGLTHLPQSEEGHIHVVVPFDPTDRLMYTPINRYGILFSIYSSGVGYVLLLDKTHFLLHSSAETMPNDVVFTIVDYKSEMEKLRAALLEINNQTSGP